MRTWNTKAWTWTVVAIAVLIRIPLLFVPLSYRIDAWRQADTASIARHFLENGFHLLYPQIYWGGDGPGYVESEFQLYPFLVAALYRVFGERLWLARLVSLLFTTSTLLVFHRLARRLLAEREALLALGFCAFSPLALRYGAAVMPEPTVVLFYVAALYAFLRWLDEDERRWLFLCGGLMAMALLVNPTALHLGLVFFLLIVQRRGMVRLLRWDLWLFALICLLPAFLWYWHARGLYLQHGNTFGILSGGDSKFGGPRYWFDPSFYARLLRLETGWLLTHLGWVLLGIGLWRAVRTGRQILALWTGTIWLYYVLVARYAGRPWGIHYHIYAVPLYALVMALGLSSLLRHRPLGWLIALLSAISFLVAAASTYHDLLRTRPGPLEVCGHAVEQLVPPGDRIIVSSPNPSIEEGVPNNYQEPVIFFYARRHGWSLAADWHTAERVEELRRKGARYLVITIERMAEPLLTYLAANARQVGPGIGQGCAVYDFR